MKTENLCRNVFVVLAVAVVLLLVFVFDATAAMSMYIACALLQMAPVSSEKATLSIISVVCLCSFSICSLKFLRRIDLYIAVQCASLLYLCFRGMGKYYFSLDRMLSSHRHWNYLEDMAQLSYLSLLLMAGVFRNIVVISILFGMLLLRSLTGKVLLVSPGMERKIRAAGEILAERRNGTAVLEPERESDIFERIEDYMKTKKPYLQEDFCMEDICTELLTNKLYVSKTINDCFDDNFRAYLNGYRVDYAKSIICENPKLKMSDIANMSGYRCLATFNSSFKEITGMTPSDYSRQEMARQRLSRNREPEL